MTLADSEEQLGALPPTRTLALPGSLLDARMYRLPAGQDSVEAGLAIDGLVLLGHALPVPFS